MKQRKAKPMTVLERIRYRTPELSEEERAKRIRAYQETLVSRKTSVTKLPVPRNLTASDIKSTLEE